MCVVKDNHLIQARLADFKMSASQNRIVAWVASLVHSRRDEEFYEVRTTVNQLNQITRHNYSRDDLEWDLRDLRKATAVIRKGSKSIICGIMDSARIDIDTGEVVMCLGKDMRPYLLKLGERRENGFTSYMLEAFLQIKSTNSQRLFELLSQWSRKGNVKFEINDLKYKMGLCDEVKQGVFEYKYPQWRDFDRRVLRQAEKDLCNAGMHVFYRGVKTGKKITHVEFMFCSNKESMDNLKEQFRSLFLYDLSDWERMQIAYSNMPQKVAMAIIEYDKTKDIKVLKALIPKSKTEFYKRFERVTKLKEQREKVERELF